jgi:ribonuclease HI
MELRAVLGLLQAIPPPEPLTIQTDSAYVLNVFTQWLPGWRRRGMRTAANKPVENVDLISEIEALLVGREITFEKVPGHAGHPLNERADALARSDAERARRTVAAEQRAQQSAP